MVMYLVCHGSANQLTSFYIMRTLFVNGFTRKYVGGGVLQQMRNL